MNTLLQRLFKLHEVLRPKPRAAPLTDEDLNDLLAHHDYEPVNFGEMPDHEYPPQAQ